MADFNFKRDGDIGVGYAMKDCWTFKLLLLYS